MPTLVFTYSPKEDVKFEEFARFLREVDQPVTLSLPSTKSSRILQVLNSNGSFECIEILEITSMEEWARDSQTEAVQKVVAEWPKFGDLESLKVYQCEEFYSG